MSEGGLQFTQISPAIPPVILTVQGGEFYAWNSPEDALENDWRKALAIIRKSSLTEQEQTIAWANTREVQRKRR